MRNIMKTISKVALALAGVVGLALAAESAQAQLVLNGAGSSEYLQTTGESPAAICAALPTPLLFVSSDGHKYEWQCTVNGVANSRLRYSATTSYDAYAKQPNGVIGTAVYLNTAGCPAGVATTILGKTVLKSVCPAGTPTQSLTVHWGVAESAASAILPQPPPASHLDGTQVMVPFAIVVGSDVKKGNGGALTSLTEREIREIIDGTITTWERLGYQGSSAGASIDRCQRSIGSRTLAMLDEILMFPKYWIAASYTGIPNPTSSDMIACINSHPNSIGYLSSDSATPTNLPSGAHQVQIDGQPVNAGALGTGKARLTALRCGLYRYWTYGYFFVTRTAGVQVAPINAVAGTNAAIASLQLINPLPDYWLSVDDAFVFKNDERGPHQWVDPSGNGELIANICN